MTSKNNITGASLVTKPTTEEFKDGWDRVFNSKNPPVWVLGEDATQVDYTNPDDASDMKPQCCGCCGDEC